MHRLLRAVPVRLAVLVRLAVQLLAVPVRLVVQLLVALQQLEPVQLQVAVCWVQGSVLVASALERRLGLLLSVRLC